MDEKVLREASLEYHRFPTPGKIAIAPTKGLTNQHDLSLAYSPGVAYACLAIKEDPGEAATLTSRANLVAVVTNGTAVLGLGNIGPLAGKPVGLCSSSEGKFAGIRCINHLRAVLVRCQMEVITPECSVSEADTAFAEDGQFRDARLHQSMERLCRTLMETSRMLSTRIEA